MNRFIFVVFVAMFAAMSTFAQDTTASSNGKADASASLQGMAAINAQLENSLDVRKAKVGDEVVLKTKKAIKENGQIIVQKGATLVGRVTEVQERAKGMAGSKIGILFDTLNQNGRSVSVRAMITSITRVTSSGINDDTFANTTATSSTRADTQSSSGGSGGLLGGVGNTVGGVVNTTTSTVSGVTRTTGDVLGTTTNTVGRTTGVVGSNIPGLQVSNSTDASVSGGSILSMSGNNLKLEKGTTFNLNVHQSGDVRASKTKPSKN